MSRRQPFRQDDPEWFRHMMELAICFVIAVIMLRGFVLEGYLISTGSMAPGLRGLHKQLQCPSCQYPFAFGVTFDESVNSEQEELGDRFATCPNCGQVNINVGNVPAAHGDQLLVQKGVFDFRSPERWETVVFLNPASPGEAYVKRVIGLPGESLQVIDGDLFVEGRIVRKDLGVQRDMRILVNDLKYQPQQTEWQLPWQLDDGWKKDATRLVFHSASTTADRQASADINQSWIFLRSWRWAGGIHACEVPLSGNFDADWEICRASLNDSPVSWMTHLTYDRERQVLRLKGVMPYQMQQEMTSWPTSAEFRAAVYRLGALSHATPVTDRYGYNSLVSSPEHSVHDLMLDTTLSWADTPEIISVALPMKNEIFRVDIRLEAESAELVLQSTGQVIAKQSLEEFGIVSHSGCRLEMSNFDRRVLIAIDGTPLFENLDLPLTIEQAIRQQARFQADDSAELNAVRQTVDYINQQNRLGLGVAGGDVVIESLQLYRDVYYTPGRRTNAIDEPCLVEDGHYFVAGDNSPVSSDSRNWPNPFVPHHLLVGKPFVVHLPSKPGKLTVGGIELPIRIPDFSRIRYIH